MHRRQAAHTGWRCTFGDIVTGWATTLRASFLVAVFTSGVALICHYADGLTGLLSGAGLLGTVSLANRRPWGSALSPARS
ncbi:hypothetical protein JOF53_003303 [Crossiella equi]|uniref:Uncharacterized protein n=1 Tax=Crossiella equi TaxID=130796 RepID=A0ABS5ACX9_9PSEU|nr:hypothetical protein [Crossiella equi]MBP2474431.1 hypothetical protein [Crossiella equi]